jgi:hypothetical protein
MTHLRTVFIATLATLALGACDKDKAKTQDPAVTADKAKPEVGDKAKPADPAKPVDPPKTEAKVTKTSALALELVEQSGKYTVRDEAYEVTFPVRPEVTGGVQPAPNGMNLRTATAMGQKSNTEAYAFFMIPIPTDVPYDVKVGLDGARDGAIKNINGTLISEVETTIGGIKGRKVIASTEMGGQKLYLQMHYGWDAGHNTMVGMFVTGETKALPEDFANSFKINPKGKAPPSK